MIINLHAKVRKTLLSFDKEKKITLLFITLLVDLMRKYLPFLTKKNMQHPLKKIFSSLYHLGVMPTKNSKLMPGMGRESTERYSSSKRLFIVPFSDKSAQRKRKSFSSEMLLIK